jgi:hypothetical protein
MADWVVYHNPDVTGKAPIRRALAVSKRQAPVTKGDTVWLIAGSGKRPRKYSLYMSFTVRTSTLSPKGWGIVIQGRFVKRPGERPLNHLSWFPRFRRRNGNFAFGLREITDRAALAGLKRL